jgi:hypothetical protein
VEARGEQVLHPVLVESQELIDTDPVERMYIHQMIAQVPSTKAYSKRHLESAKQLLRLINEVMTMGTPAGFAAFRDPRITAMLKKILTAWCKFLSKKDSLYVLNDSPSGWKCAAAQKAVGIEQHEHDPEDEHWGFASWNDFFTRRFKDGQRPIASPDDDKVIVSACESTPYDTGSPPTSSAKIASGSRANRIRFGTCWPTTSRSISSSAEPSIRPFSAPLTTIAGTARWPARLCGRSPTSASVSSPPKRKTRQYSRIHRGVRG